jgi:hypothetical protein
MFDEIACCLLRALFGYIIGAGADALAYPDADAEADTDNIQ